MSTYYWMAILLVVALYCIVQAIRDFRQHNYLWGSAAAVCAALLLLSPIESHAVKLDLPISDGKRT